MKNHANVRQKFVDHLELSQSNSDAIDIREYVLKLKYEKLTIGYVKGTLDKFYGANLKRIFKEYSSLSDKDWEKNNVFLCTGSVLNEEDISHKGAVKLFDKIEDSKKIIFFEQGFLASSHSWSHSFKHGDPKFACLGYIYDDISYYYMADYPNRLTQKLNSKEELSKDELARSKKCIETIISQHISKYNAQPLQCPTMTQGYKRRVLVCDQAFADASTIYGKVTEQDFQNMLVAAIHENPDAEVIIKTHPDSHWEKNRSGYYTHIKSYKNVRVINEPVNPYSLFENVDTVYVGTSGMGLEALLAGKKVVTFGVPFYAGWGLTDDRKVISHRNRNRSLEDIFYFFYIWYTIYHRPDREGVCEIEDVIEYIIENRPVTFHDEIPNSTTPKVSIILPVYGVEAYIKECLESIQNQTLRDIEIIPVNDCSPDNSQVIIDSLAESDPRIKPIVLKKNVGQGFARNEGIKVAKGEYIWFIDSDDFFTSNDVLEKLYKSALENSADMVRGKKACERHEDLNGKHLKNVADFSEKYFNQDVVGTNFSSNTNLLYNRHFWVFLYKREFLESNKIVFDITQWEEKPFLLKALLNAKAINILKLDTVTYRVRQTSTARREKNIADFELQLKNFELVVDLLAVSKALEDTKLKKHASFILSQYLHYLIFGMCSRLSIDGIVDVPFKTLITRIKVVFESIGFEPKDISDMTQQIDKYDFADRKYHLILSLILADDSETIVKVREGKPIDQFELYHLYEKYSENDAALSYINTYFRNDRVFTNKSKSLSFNKPKVIIHIGSTKTGSTYIQHHLENNRPKLLEQGIYYPEVGLFWQKERPEKQAGHAPFATAAIHNDRSLLEHVESAVAYHGSKLHTVILSSEAFFLNKKAVELVSYFKSYPCTMMLYLRRQDDWANSQYCEFVAGGAVGRTALTIDEWLKTDKALGFMDYYGLVNHWANVLDEKNIIVRPYIRSQLVNQDILEDFCHTLSLEKVLDHPKPPSSQQNDALLNTNYVHILRKFNSLPFKNNREDYLAFVSELVNKLKDFSFVKSEKTNFLSAEARSELLDFYKNDNELLTKEFSNVPLFEYVINDQDTSKTSTITVEEFDVLFDTYFDKSNLLNDYSDMKRKLKNAHGRIRYLENINNTNLSLVKDDVKQVSSAKPSSLVNYGYWDWRFYAFKPLLKLLLKKRITSPKDLEAFERDPYQFLSNFEDESYTLMRKVFFPQFSVYGIFNYLSVLKPYVSKRIEMIDSEAEASLFKENEILYFRNLKNKKYQRIGKFLYPIGRKKHV